MNTETRKNQIIDSKEGEYCVYIPTYECVKTYDRLTFFGQNIKGSEVR